MGKWDKNLSLAEFLFKMVEHLKIICVCVNYTQKYLLAYNWSTPSFPSLMWSLRNMEAKLNTKWPR